MGSPSIFILQPPARIPPAKPPRMEKFPVRLKSDQLNPSSMISAGMVSSLAPSNEPISPQVSADW